DQLAGGGRGRSGGGGGLVLALDDRIVEAGRVVDGRGGGRGRLGRGRLDRRSGRGLAGVAHGAVCSWPASDPSTSGKADGYRLGSPGWIPASSSSRSARASRSRPLARAARAAVRSAAHPASATAEASRPLTWAHVVPDPSPTMRPDGP